MSQVSAATVASWDEGPNRTTMEIEFSKGRSESATGEDYQKMKRKEYRTGLC